jgi:hypothetical protein
MDINKYIYTALIFIMFIASVIGGLGMSKYRNDSYKDRRLLEACLHERDEWQNAYTNLSKTNLLPIILRLQPRLDNKIAIQIEAAILLYSARYKLPPRLMVHVMHRESRFNPLAKSSKGAVGLMQIMVKAHKDKLEKMGIKPEEAYHIANNVRLGCWIFRDYFDETNDVEKALLKYVGGNHEKYVNDILIGFTNEAIVGVKNVQRVQENGEGKQDVEGEVESERGGEHEEESSNAQNSSPSS